MGAHHRLAHSAAPAAADSPSSVGNVLKKAADAAARVADAAAVAVVVTAAAWAWAAGIGLVP